MIITRTNRVVFAVLWSLVLACSPSPEQLRAEATTLEEQRTQLVTSLWGEFQKSASMGTLDLVAAKVAPKGDSAGEQLARGLVGSVLQGVKSGVREQFDQHIAEAGTGRVVNSGSVVLDDFFAQPGVRAKCREATELRAKVDSIRAKLTAIK